MLNLSQVRCGLYDRTDLQLFPLVLWPVGAAVKLLICAVT